MKINSYSVGFDVKHKSLSADYQKLDISESKTNLANSKATSVKKMQSSADNTELIDAKLSAKMQIALLNRLKEHNRTVEYESLYAEYEELNFSTKAIIKADGKELSVNLDANLKRSFVQKEKIILNGKEFKDPLIISLDGNMPQLGHDTFSFDIDSDGTKDQISTLKYGSGFLALDINENGKIDDGSELFGTKSGNGFKDLSTYDDDKNGWIDENDKIFDKLRIWQKTGSESKLVGLGEVGIGAIFLGSASANFSYKSLEDNSLQGQMRNSGFFVFEDGKAGIISQIDLAVYGQEVENKSQITEIKDLFAKGKGKVIYGGLVSDTKDTENLNISSTKDNSSIIDKLKAKIKALQAKLLKSNSKEAGSIQSQIMSLNIQIINLVNIGVK